VFFKIKRKTAMRKLMDAYCRRQGQVPGSVRFTFDGNRVNPDSTPDSYNMEDQDVIDAMVEQIGGRRFYFM
jgi:small ubiquitin-related modifier